MLKLRSAKNVSYIRQIKKLNTRKICKLSKAETKLGYFTGLLDANKTNYIA